MNRTIGIFAALLVVSFSASAQQPALHGPLLDNMIGSWVLQGTIDGKETTHDIDAEWVLNSGYVRLHEVSREMNASGDRIPIVFKAASGESFYTTFIYEVSAQCPDNDGSKGNQSGL
jgi:hypothetical protein